MNGRAPDRRMKVQFAKNVVKHGGNRTLAYQETFKVTKGTAKNRGYKLFRDPIVQEVYQDAGVDLEYLSKRSKDLMDSPNLSVAAGLIKHYTKPLLETITKSRTERINVNLFGDLNDNQLERIKAGRKITRGTVVQTKGETGTPPEVPGGTSEASPEPDPE